MLPVHFGAWQTIYAWFRELARRPGIDLQVVYGVKPGIPNVPAEGFRAIPLSRWHKDYGEAFKAFLEKGKA